jgi:hypothetical protein
MKFYNDLVKTKNIALTDISISNYTPKKYLKGCDVLFEQKMNTSMKIWLILLDINGRICVFGRINATFLKELYQTNQHYIAFYNQGKTYIVLHEFIMDFPNRIFNSI